MEATLKRALLKLRGDAVKKQKALKDACAEVLGETQSAATGPVLVCDETPGRHRL